MGSTHFKKPRDKPKRSRGGVDNSPLREGSPETMGLMLRIAAIILVALCPTVAALPANMIAWGYGALPGTMTLTGFQVRRCSTNACINACAPTDLDTGSVGPTTFTFADPLVVAAISYIYEVQAVGTVDGVPQRSSASNQ